jgi:hypothetical protein
MQQLQRVAASFRDPGGFVFRQDGVVYRCINNSYAEDYTQLMSSGLYKKLVNESLIISHEEQDDAALLSQIEGAYKILKPVQIPFISYPYEWCFGQLKEAALVTLKVAKYALDFDMVLKDAANRNIQFVNGKAQHIDTLSFERYSEGTPWLAYRQFCEHFLVPLTLMSNVDIRSNSWLMSFPDGFPLDLGAKMLNLRQVLNPWLAIHIYMHAKLQSSTPEQKVKSGTRKMSKREVQGLIDSLEQAVSSSNFTIKQSTWSDYYTTNTYSEIATNSKQRIVGDFVHKCQPKIVWDLGANDGGYARTANPDKTFFVSIEQDPVCVEQNYRQCAKKAETYILPLVGNISHPSPGLGWDNVEFDSLIGRGPADCVLALGLIHHLVISNCAKLDQVSNLFKKIGKHVIVEFIPSDDQQVQRMLSNRWLRENPYSYSQDQFENIFQNDFKILAAETIEDSQRRLYLLQGKS